MLHFHSRIQYTILLENSPKKKKSCVCSPLIQTLYTNKRVLFCLMWPKISFLCCPNSGRVDLRQMFGLLNTRVLRQN